MFVGEIYYLFFYKFQQSFSFSKIFSVAETDSQPDEEKKWIEKKIDSIDKNSNSSIIMKKA